VWHGAVQKKLRYIYTCIFGDAVVFGMEIFAGKKESLDVSCTAVWC
jgi:hypothetical protein